MKKSIIFCVDDEKMVLNSLKTELKSSFGETYIIETAETAKEALEAISDLLVRGHKIPLIISDYAMPVMKGDEFLTIIHDNYPDILKILLTGQATVEGVSNTINNANLYRYIAKPWETNDLVLTITKALKSHADQNLLEQKNKQLNELSKSLEIKVELRTKELQEKNNLLLEKSKEIEDQNSELLNYRNHLEDIVKIRTSELVKAKEKAEESDRLKSSFMANISHEIRTPMNGIIGFIELLKNPDLEQSEKHQFFEVVQNCSQQLLSIITDIIEISKLETNQVQLKLSACNLQSIQNNISAYFDHNIFNKAQIEFKVSSIKEELNFTTDEVKLQQIIINLINNAVKFTHRGTIEFGCSLLNGNEILFFVKDTGVGIAKEYHHLIFDRFRQIETELSKNQGGTGLGLSISHAYVTLLGGKIWIESELNKGSIFYFTIPNIPVQTAKNTLQNENNYLPSGLKGITILVAEDDNTNFALLDFRLKRLDIKIIRATNGLEAVNICKTIQDINLVLMDIKMPLMNGIEATKEIRKFRKGLPIIAQTAGAFSNDKEEALNSGCVDYISKPINFEELNKKMHKYSKIVIAQ